MQITARHDLQLCALYLCNLISMLPPLQGGGGQPWEDSGNSSKKCTLQTYEQPSLYDMLSPSLALSFSLPLCFAKCKAHVSINVIFNNSIEMKHILALVGLVY